MKVTKRQVAEITRFIETYWRTYFSGDLETWATFLPDDYRNIGTTNEELWNSKQEILDYTLSVFDQMIGMAEVRERKIEIIPYQDYFMVHELADLYVKSENDWAFYAPIRLSSLLEKNDDNWLVLHQHGSYPDSRTEKGEAFAVDALKAENKKLHAAVAKRTNELEVKNRELEIEAGLERVRTRAMAMQGSDELSELVDVVFHELTTLDFALTACIINIIDGDDKSNTVWITNPETGKDPEAYYLKFEDHQFHHGMWKAWKARKKNWVYTIEGTEKEIYQKYLFNETEFRRFSKEAQLGFTDLERWVASFTFSNFGGIQTVGEEPLSEENLDILARFGKVFDLTYTRFNDLKQAEAQAREANIEAALERVRSHSLAMHKSDELNEVVSILFEKLKELQIPVTAVGIGIKIDGSRDLNGFVCGENADGLVITNYRLPYFNNKISRDICNALERQLDFFVGHYSKKDKNSFYKYLLEHTPEFGQLPEDIKNMIFESPSYTISTVAVKNAVFNINDFEGKVLSNNDVNIIKRFARVFEQAYTRFLDLQKAEAQAKEALLESALEKVRSQSNGMQGSEDLSKVTTEMFDQLRQFDADLFATGIVFCDKHEGSVEQWHSLPDAGMMQPFIVPIDLDYIHQFRYNQWKKGNELFSIEIPSDFIEEHFNDIFNLPSAQLVLQEFEANNTPMPPTPDWEIDYGASFKNGYILISSLQPFEDVEILPRFAQVFEQAYTRFLDLQKAEEQAREAQIEVALERVRNKAMAMRSSEELADLLVTVFKELQGMDMALTRCLLWLFNQDDQSATIWMANSENPDYADSYHIPNHNHPAYKSFLKGWKSQEPKWEYSLKGKNKAKWDEILVYGYFKSLPAKVKKAMKEPEKVILSGSFNKYGVIQTAGLDVLSSENQEILLRFSQVFEQTYSRYRDLKKAEAQAREAQINLTVERVRAKALAMHKSEEIMEVVAKLKDEVMSLDIPGVVAATIFLKEEDKVRMWDLSSVDKVEDGYQVHLDLSFKLKKSDPNLYVKRVWENQENYFVEIQDKKGFNRLMSWMREHDKDKVADEIGEIIKTTQLKRLFHAVTKLSNGKLAIDLMNPPSAEIETILTKMGAAFDLAYKRFEDLKKAESQAREAQIEAALERVRSRTMAMQRSEEMPEVANNLFLQVQELEFPAWSAGYCIWENDKGSASCSMSSEGVIQKSFSLPTIGEGYDFTTPLKNGESFYVAELGGKELVKHYKFMRKLPVVGEILDGILSAGFELPTFQIFHIVYFKHGYLMFITYEPVPEAHDIFKRFAAVFEQTYTRFLDLQKAEEQAREAQIEAGLERVRSKALAMHNSEDLAQTVDTFFTQLKILGVTPRRCGVTLINKDSKVANLTVTSATDKGKEIQMTGNLTLAGHPILDNVYRHWVDQKEYHPVLEGKELKDYYKFMNPEMEFPSFKKDTIQYGHYFFFNEGGVYAWTDTQLSEEDLSIFRKFKSVLSLTYRRYIDLIEAEMLAREAQIEVALERVRSQAMAMQHSDDLVKCTTIVFEELEKLELPVKRSGIGIFDEETKGCQLWTTVVDKKGKMAIATGITSLTIHPLLIETFKAWKAQESYSYVLEEKELIDYYKVISKGDFTLPKDEVGSSTSLPKEYYIYAPFGAGGIYLFAESEPTDSDKQIIRRFAEVFHMTYTRYEDLQKAEARALEATRQASLDRIRGEISSMRATEDLQRITPLVWKELLAMQVPFIRCGVFIMNDTSSTIKAYLSAPDGHSLGVLNLPFDATEFTKGAVDHWHQRKMYKIHWNKQQFQENMKSMIDKGQIIHDAANYQGPEKPPESLYLHFISFKQGLLYAGNSETLSSEALESVKALADSFSIAYSRYEDFKQLETAIGELKSTQSQLIHAEKMASLGELTAGIAHEIQNPLNFVNNFSEVNKELIEELQEELLKGDIEEATEIAQIIIDNEEKIVHHGRRAEGIVKGMLQHSRSSSGEKEPTDINLLADEYLRLSYHGLRAKDKSFNADFVTVFDEALPKVNVVPQDIGRVLLNLINNAFHAVRVVKKPKVVVQTRHVEDKIEIQVSDNGSGIPDDIKEKIFQPFFTTKATGEGTGLGLSLSYDIITKGHSGELNLETSDGEGSTFTILLPN